MLGHINLTSNSDKVSATLNGPLLKKYAKAPEHDYSPDFRQQLLAEYRRTANEEINKGLRWLERHGANHSPIKTAADKFGLAASDPKR